jgi:DNA-binding transcriptional LysR family regulator
MIPIIMNPNVWPVGVGPRLFEGDLQQLRCFYYAATYGSFTRAAEELATGQPSVSNRIKQLERLLGTRLFYRRRQGVELTPAGRVLRDLASPLIEALDRLPHELDERTGALTTTEVRVAAGQELLLHVLAPVIQAFRRDNPAVRLVVRASVRDETQAIVARSEVDFGLVARTGLPPGLDFQELLSDELVLIVPRGHELADRDPISFTDVALYPTLMPDRHSSTRNTIEVTFAQSGLDLQIAMELERWHIIKEFVALGQGIAFVPSFSLTDNDDRLAVRRVEPRFPRLSYGIIRRAGAYLSPAARSLIEAIQRHERKRSSQRI